MVLGDSRESTGNKKYDHDHYGHDANQWKKGYRDAHSKLDGVSHFAAGAIGVA
jgi:hypothetical protein